MGCELHAAVAAAAPSQGSGRNSPPAIHAELVDCEENLCSSVLFYVLKDVRGTIMLAQRVMLGSS